LRGFAVTEADGGAAALDLLDRFAASLGTKQRHRPGWSSWLITWIV
jgi:hypothetical protein